MSNLLAEAESLFEYTQTLRRDFHRHPELGFSEFRTAGVIARELGKLGIEVTTGVAKTGVVGLLEGSQPGPVILLRFDMDALPIQEETGAEYASENSGVMHACGHDGHVAVGLTVARLLDQWRDKMRGTVKLVFQPAEEGAGGAEQMIEAGVLANPKPDYMLALHIWNEKPLGWVGVVPGPLMAGADLFQVLIEGKGGHGAMPNSAVDPIVTGAQMITALQTIVSRNLSPLESAVVTVGRLRAGDAFNVIPQTAELSGTIRTFDPAVRQKVLARFEEITSGIGAAMGCKVTTRVQLMTPAVVNDPQVAGVVRQAVQKLLPDAELDVSYQTMVSEDMAFMMASAPACYFMVGSANAEKGLTFGHHHPRFDIDEAVLPRAAAIMAQSALDLLSV